MGMFDEAAKKRANDTAALEQNLKGTQKVTHQTNNTAYKKDESNLTKITLSISETDRDKVKVYAALHHTSVSQLLHNWIKELDIPTFD